METNINPEVPAGGVENTTHPDPPSQVEKGTAVSTGSPSKDSVPSGIPADGSSQSHVTLDANPNPTAPRGHGGGAGAPSRPRPLIPLGNPGSYTPSERAQNDQAASRFPSHHVNQESQGTYWGEHPYQYGAGRAAPPRGGWPTGSGDQWSHGPARYGYPRFQDVSPPYGGDHHAWWETGPPPQKRSYREDDDKAITIEVLAKSLEASNKRQEAMMLSIQALSESKLAPQPTPSPAAVATVVSQDALGGPSSQGVPSAQQRTHNPNLNEDLEIHEFGEEYWDNENNRLSLLEQYDLMESMLKGLTLKRESKPKTNYLSMRDDDEDDSEEEEQRSPKGLPLHNAILSGLDSKGTDLTKVRDKMVSQEGSYLKPGKFPDLTTFNVKRYEPTDRPDLVSPYVLEGGLSDILKKCDVDSLKGKPCLDFQTTARLVTENKRLLATLSHALWFQQTVKRALAHCRELTKARPSRKDDQGKELEPEPYGVADWVEDSFRISNLSVSGFNSTLKATEHLSHTLHTGVLGMRDTVLAGAKNDLPSGVKDTLRAAPLGGKSLFHDCVPGAQEALRQAVAAKPQRVTVEIRQQRGAQSQGKGGGRGKPQQSAGPGKGQQGHFRGKSSNEYFTSSQSDNQSQSQKDAWQPKGRGKDKRGWGKKDGWRGKKSGHRGKGRGGQ